MRLTQVRACRVRSNLGCSKNHPLISHHSRHWLSVQICKQRDQVFPGLVRWKAITRHFDLSVRIFQIDFQDLIQQIVVPVELIQGNFKKLEL